MRTGQSLASDMLCQASETPGPRPRTTQTTWEAIRENLTNTEKCREQHWSLNQACQPEQHETDQTHTDTERKSSVPERSRGEGSAQT